MSFQMLGATLIKKTNTTGSMIPFFKINFNTKKKKIGKDKIGDFGKMRTEGYDCMC